jgi:NADH-quinone oxidoreductase subunit M
MLIALATLGLPGLNGFVGEYLIMAGTYAASFPLLLLAAAGVILAAWYTLRLYQGIMNGSPTLGREEVEGTDPARRRAELGSPELRVLLPLAAVAVAVGAYPAPLLALVNNGVGHLSRVLSGGG